MFNEYLLCTIYDEWLDVGTVDGQTHTGQSLEGRNHHDRGIWPVMLAPITIVFSNDRRNHNS